MNSDDIKKLMSVALKNEHFSLIDMESFNDDAASAISRAKLNALIKVVMKDSTDEEKDAYRNNVAEIYKRDTDLKISNTLKLYTDPDVLTAMGIKEDEHEETIELMKEHLSVDRKLVDDGIAAVVTEIKKMKV